MGEVVVYFLWLKQFELCFLVLTAGEGGGVNFAIWRLVPAVLSLS